MSYDGLLCYKVGGLLGIIVKEKVADGVAKKLMEKELLNSEEWNDRYTTADGLVYSCACEGVITVEGANSLEKLAKSLNMRIIKFNKDPPHACKYRRVANTARFCT